MEKFQTIIIGGGAAGLMAAITSAKQGFKTAIIEKNKALGRKILVTGNGRCNLTNIDISPDKYYGQNTKCLHSIFNRFSSKDAMVFFEHLGAQLKTEEAGRVFPVTNQASTIVDLLIEEVERLGIKVHLQESVRNLDSPLEFTPLDSRLRGNDKRGGNDSGGRNGWKVETHRGEYQADNVILAVGGQSYPQLGTTGDGFMLAHKLGHRIIEPRPALVPLELVGNWFHKLQGVKSDVELILTAQGKIVVKEVGELLFTHYGISGPIVLNMSRLINTPHSEFTINFFPGNDVDKLKALLSKRWQAHPQKTLANSLIGLLPKKLCDVLTTELKLADRQVSQLTKQDVQFIAERLIRWSIAVKKPRPFEEAMVTAGGVAMDEINTRTMESLKAKGLYLAGEILDIDGVSGGYNLQFAWSTGYIAGLQGTVPKIVNNYRDNLKSLTQEQKGYKLN
ncbi:MAG: NAD(P)/FAD-dependent oxidoreductase [Planctomycetes bacterium]|nr:NAD(P)/FAD-dependent oxidoreductase [Planctomycetota bacterium]